MVGRVGESRCKSAFRRKKSDLEQVTCESRVAELELTNLQQMEFISTVSHELRAPVSNMRMAATMLELVFCRINSALPTEAQAEGVNAVRYLQIMMSECDREIALINNLLDLQRLEAGVESMVVEEIDLQTWLPQIVLPFQERAHCRGQNLSIRILNDVPPVVSSPEDLKRIIVELLNNACKYTEFGEDINGVIEFCNLTAPKVQIRISNRGEIDSLDLPRIFDKFYRSNAVVGKQGGTGLGLALVKKLTERLGGHVWVESLQGQTCFTVELPIFIRSCSFRGG